MTNMIPERLSSDAPPARALLAMIFGAVQTQLLSVTAQLGIPDLLKDSPKSVKALAEATGTQEPALSRLLRALTDLGIVVETAPGQFICTPMGALLQADSPNSLREYAMLFGRSLAFDTWANLLHSVHTGMSAFEDRFGMNIYRLDSQWGECTAESSRATAKIARKSGFDQFRSGRNDPVR
ncbi:winged helix-turn-helix domain-containing protein [Nostoc sp. UHCC 0302]|uniref:winged helix-turn-helix domain-containing protein n=1 Tax=Nostoc sp. UHCC 0302 TaxID=3134896 RepID=UPI00311C9F79